MKKIFKIAAIAIIGSTALSISSCQKFLEIDPPTVIPNDQAITTAKDLETVMYGAYDGLQNGNVLGGTIFGYMDLMADDGTIRTQRLSPFGTEEIYSGNTSVQIGALRGIWADNYSTINRLNNIIAAIDGGTISGAEFDAGKDRLKGEALGLRALLHFNLVQLWALPYDISKKGNNTQPGVVLRTVPTLNAQQEVALPRASVEEVYSQVIKDLQESVQLLGISGQRTSLNRFSQNAAKAILARVYFYSGDYENAYTVSNEIILSNDYALADSANLLPSYNYAGTSTPPGGLKPEVIFQLVNVQLDQSNGAFGFYTQAANPFMDVSGDLFSTYEEKDIRRTQLIFNPNPAVSIRVCRKYNRASGSNVLPNPRIIRLAEVHLIRAESALRKSGADVSVALQSLNTIRQRALNSEFVPETETDVNLLLEKVMLERRKELRFEGDRYMNLRRLGLPIGNGPNSTLNYAKFLFKIPQEEIAGNPAIEQNP
jgi:starch-binding outer membrane protein, SusD/RagB family